MASVKALNFPFESKEFSGERNLLSTNNLVSPRRSTLSFLADVLPQCFEQPFFSFVERTSVADWYLQFPRTSKASHQCLL